MLLMVEKRIRGGICHCIYHCAKTTNKYMKGYDKNKELAYIKYWDINNLNGWAMSQKHPINNFAWIKDYSQFNEDSIKNMMKTVMKDILFKLMFIILKN